MVAVTVAAINKPHALVERIGNEYVVVLVSPTGARDYYVATGIDEQNQVIPYVCEDELRAKKFGLERTARVIASDMTAFLNKQYSNLVKWYH